MAARLGLLDEAAGYLELVADGTADSVGAERARGNVTRTLRATIDRSGPRRPDRRSAP